ncbi:MAG: hypothetical protein M1377_01775 [Deltaproteobacteria bacterium]|nr:hypothetical protein [Deltaproteobacteria bacterium]
MNKEEEKILHGLYYNREIVGEEVPYSPSEINWLIKSSLKKGREWRGNDGKLQSIYNENDNYLESIGATSAAAERPLTYLQEAGYIRYKKDSNYFRVAVTGKGADYARDLDTLTGRINIWYKNKKDGILWFIISVLVTIITAILVSLITNSMIKVSK